MDVKKLQKGLLAHRVSLLQEGLLDENFIQMHRIQYDSKPGFVVEIYTDYFGKSQRIFNDLERTLKEPHVDFNQVDESAHDLKGCSGTVGAHRVVEVCNVIRTMCREQNFEGCMRFMQQLKQELHLVKRKLQNLFVLEQQILEAGGSIPKFA